jgi:hypothetical protein
MKKEIFLKKKIIGAGAATAGLEFKGLGAMQRAEAFSSTTQIISSNNKIFTHSVHKRLFSKRKEFTESIQQQLGIDMEKPVNVEKLIQKLLEIQLDISKKEQINVLNEIKKNWAEREEYIRLLTLLNEKLADKAKIKKWDIYNSKKEALEMNLKMKDTAIEELTNKLEKKIVHFKEVLKQIEFSKALEEDKIIQFIFLLEDLYQTWYIFINISFLSIVVIFIIWFIFKYKDKINKIFIKYIK